MTPTVDPASEVRRRIEFLVEYLKSSGQNGLVLGISGGQDSSLAGRLCQMAVERLRAAGGQAVFTAVRLPYGIQVDEADAELALQFIAPDRRLTFNIKPAVDSVAGQYLDAVKVPLSDFAKGNVKARVRMTAQYAIAGESRSLVVGTDHAAEAVTGFFTKFGDGGADVLPLAGLSKRQGRLLLEHLGAPPRLYEKVPTADLLDDQPGQSDEENLGIRYADIDDYLAGEPIDDEAAAALESRYRATEHKRRPPVSMFEDWWRV